MLFHKTKCGTHPLFHILCNLRSLGQYTSRFSFITRTGLDCCMSAEALLERAVEFERRRTIICICIRVTWREKTNKRTFLALLRERTHCPKPSPEHFESLRTSPSLRFRSCCCTAWCRQYNLRATAAAKVGQPARRSCSDRGDIQGEKRQKKRTKQKKARNQKTKEKKTVL